MIFSQEINSKLIQVTSLIKLLTTQAALRMWLNLSCILICRNRVSFDHFNFFSLENKQFKRNRIDTFSYKSQVINGINGTTEDVAEMLMYADVTIKNEDGCEFIMEVGVGGYENAILCCKKTKSPFTPFGPFWNHTILKTKEKNDTLGVNRKDKHQRSIWLPSMAPQTLQKSCIDPVKYTTKFRTRFIITLRTHSQIIGSEC